MTKIALQERFKMPSLIMKQKSFGGVSGIKITKKQIVHMPFITMIPYTAQSFGINHDT